MPFSPPWLLFSAPRGEVFCTGFLYLMALC